TAILVERNNVQVSGHRHLAFIATHLFESHVVLVAEDVDDTVVAANKAHLLERNSVASPIDIDFANIAERVEAILVKSHRIVVAGSIAGSDLDLSKIGKSDLAKPELVSVAVRGCQRLIPLTGLGDCNL